MAPRWRVMVVTACAIVLVAASAGALFILNHKPSHPPISIVGDSSFTQENGIMRGDGSPQNPYVIEGWDIIAPSNESGIFIGNTDAHLLIRNVDIHSNDSAWFGVCLEHSSNITLENVKMTGCWNGIRLDYCFNVAIRRCDVSSNLYGGIEIIRSEKITVTENRAGNNHLHNLYVSLTNGCNVTGNEFPAGKEEWRARDNILSYHSCVNVTFSANVMSDCSLWFSNCTRFDLSQNRFSDTSILFDGSSDGAFVKNEMTNRSYLEFFNSEGITMDRDYPQGPPGV